MDNVIVSSVFVLVIISVWILPNVYPVVATIVLAGLSAYSGNLTTSSVVILFILGVTGYQLLQEDGKRNILLRLNILLIVFWALWSENFQAGVVSWTNYFQMLSVKYLIVIQVTFEKFFTALLLAAYILKPKITQNYWRRGLSGTWEVLLLVYLALLVPLVAVLYFFAGLRIGDFSLFSLILTLIIICFTEEILYRLILQNWLYRVLRVYSKSLASWLAITIVSVIYALFHIELGWLAVSAYCFVGAAYGYVYQKSGKIEVAILVHFAVRLTLGLVLAFYSQSMAQPILIN